MSVDLSILICSTHTRWRTFGRSIQEQVWAQYDSLPADQQERIEILMLTDNRRMVLGDKRNVMVDAAQGRYVQFIDDDDRISPRMFEKVLAATESDADVITFLVDVSMNGRRAGVCRYSIRFDCDRNTPQRFERLPNHICAVKRELAQRVTFPAVLCGEDAGYAKKLAPLLNSEHHIPEVLYHYDFSELTTETQGRRRRSRRQPEPSDGAVVDVVIMSNARNARMAGMTQRAIDTCIAGANGLPVNVFVVEQYPATHYRDAVTLPPPYPEFNYHGYANYAAAQGNAPWVMVANNDLVFSGGWLQALLAVEHPVVSPKCPKDSRQRGVVKNEMGFHVGRNLSGWCFMVEREFFTGIGGFDEEFGFWCADDAFVEQCRAAGVAPMVVPSATVEHLGSVTLKSSGSKRVYDELTWSNIDRFVAKYGNHPLVGSAGYQAWKRRVSA